MKYRTLGRTGLKVSEICLGTLYSGYWTEEADTKALVVAALDAGVNFIDTANKYGHGKAEQWVGDVVRDRGGRDRLILATKFAFDYGETGDSNKPGIGRHQVMRECELSLKRLGTDYIDVYYVHRPDPLVPIDETLRALDDLIRAGKVRYVGCSVFGAWRVIEALWAAKELGLNRFVIDQSPYSLMDRQVELELLPALRSYGLGFCPYAPLAGGLLTAKYRRGHDEDRQRGTRFGPGGHNPPRLGPITDRQFDVIDLVVARAAANKCTPLQYALAWLLSRPGLTSVVIGPRNAAQLPENLAAVDVQANWGAEDAAIDAVVAPGHYVLNQFWGERPTPRPNQHGWT